VSGYIIRRLMQSVLVMVGVTVIVFGLVHLLPGGPARALLGPTATEAQVRAFTVANGYNRPIVVQYVTYVLNLLHGQFGYSYSYQQSVSSLLAQNIPKTALLIGVSYFAALAIAIPLGLVQAVRRNGVLDHLSTTVTFILYSMPVFWLATLLILGLSIAVHVFPAEGPQGATVMAALSDPVALVLPVASLTLVTVALFSRFVRSSAAASLVQDYIRTARAKGASESRVVFLHLLRNSLGPVITLVGLSLPGVIAGAIVVESVFNYPGMGLLLWKAATTHDYPLIMGVTVVVGVATVLGNLVADVGYALADPRIHYASAA